MNVYFVLLGAGCQLTAAYHYGRQASIRQIAPALRIQYGVMALFFGELGCLLIYGWLVYGTGL